MKSILIAHQSTIPHYRVPFFNTLEKLRPNQWRFEVVFDPSEINSPIFFKEPIDVTTFRFPTKAVRTFSIKIRGKRLTYQTFWRAAAQYDLVILENALNNLTYPLIQLHQLRSTLIAFWGHGRDRSVVSPSVGKRMSEGFKRIQTRSSRGFFAYTEGVKKDLLEQGISSEKIYVVNNTIDISAYREVYHQKFPQREAIQAELGVKGKKVLLYVGRFTPNKRIRFLLEAFSILWQKDPNYQLFMVGGGGSPDLTTQLEGVDYFRTVVDIDKLARIYLASDLYVIPGAIGLGPLQALCFDLPVVTIESRIHGPEKDYLSSENSILLEANSTPENFANAIDALFSNQEKITVLKSGVWSSIQHLTIEKMAEKFIFGVNNILQS